MADGTGTFPDDIRFRQEWRAYQARVLEHLDSYIGDNKLHLVAAPGSGKTVLGLEIVRRFNHPTLVLAPTITIREQWAERFVQHFMDGAHARPDWISTDIHRPAKLTIATYQGLHSVCCGEPEATTHDAFEASADEPYPESSHLEAEQRKIPATLASFGFKTLVVDEAHHLRAEWWKSLNFLAEQLDDPRIVALTATPPYDVTPYEWQKYEQLCGPVDAEVSVPELVLHGDLCPHQDYVYFTLPEAREQQTLAAFRDKVQQFVSRLKTDVTFVAAVEQHPFVRSPQSHEEEILETPEYFSSMLIFLHAAGREVPWNTTAVLALDRKKLPALTLDWVEILLSELLFDESVTSKEATARLRALRAELSAMGALERRKVKLTWPSDHLKLLTSSSTKLGAIEEIVKIESSSLGDRLRCVVLTDFIRKNELSQIDTAEIGVVPIFERLRQAKIPGVKLGVLSGSLVILPADSAGMLRDCATIAGIDARNIKLETLSHDPDYSVLTILGAQNQNMVQLITAAFERGTITVLVGTKALLGEGWDAPAINTLVLASFVGSYVLSNQMRGRSIRTDPAHPDKTANIWHLVCLEPGVFGPGPDFELLTRRCNCFLGVHASKPAIENGTERLGFGRPPFASSQIPDLNANTVRRALDRHGLRQAWKDALASGDIQELTHGVKTDETILPRGFLMRGTIAALGAQGVLAFVQALLRNFQSLGNARDWQQLISIGVALCMFGSIACAPWLALAVWRLIRHGTPERSLKQIGKVILESLEYEGTIEAGTDPFEVYADTNGDGTVYCWLRGGGGKEQSEFVRALRECLQPVANPRYLLARKAFFRFTLEDYFAVPEIFGRKKEFAEYFAGRWNKAVCPAKLVFTRNAEGRKTLLRARAKSLAASFQDKTQQVSCWK